MVMLNKKNTKGELKSKRVYNKESNNTEKENRNRLPFGGRMSFGGQYSNTLIHSVVI